jgi:hypothetical protein
MEFDSHVISFSLLTNLLQDIKKDDIEKEIIGN